MSRIYVAQETELWVALANMTVTFGLHKTRGNYWLGEQVLASQ
jgi:hypothetical protein